ncbi:MAG: hypothetical protein Q8R18_01165 [bacterium]|nr:hypothetical protein [bacterium]
MNEASFIDYPTQYYDVQNNVSLQVLQQGNESIVYFSLEEEYFMTVYA